MTKCSVAPRIMITSAFALAIILSSTMNAQVAKEDLARVINIEKLQHPYLYFTEAEKPAILARIKNDPESRDIMAGLLAEGHRLLYVPVKNPPPQQIEHQRFSAAVDEASAYASEISEGAVKLAFLYQMTGDARYARKAVEFSTAICDLVEWVGQAHKFDIIYPRVWPWNVPDDRVVFSYDIFAADKAIAVSTVYDWVYPVLTKIEKDKLRNGLLEKAITRVRGNYEFFWWASAYRCNWSAICFSGLGIAAATLLKEHPQLLDVMAETHNRLNLTFGQIGDDGGWQEGRGYYGYMMRVSVQYMEILKRLSGGKYNLFRQAKVHSHPVDFLLYGLSANFEDSEGGVSGATHIVNKLADETKNSTAAFYREKFLGQGTTLFDILWPRTTVQPVEPALKSGFFGSINWAILRSDFFDPSSVTVACKAGYNDDPHHGHLDCGQFNLTWYGVPFIRDLGRMRYDELYFNEDRWSYPYGSSEGHNLIFVNGERQIPAKLKDQPWKEGVGGRILDFQTSTRQDYVLMDPTHAYPGKELKKWRRSIVLDKPATTIILDEVSSIPGASIEARFFPGYASTAAPRPGREQRTGSTGGVESKIYSGYVMLSADRHRLALIPLVLDNSAAIAEGKLPDVPVTEDSRLSWIRYLAAVTTARSTTTLIVTLLLPVSDEKDAEASARNAKVEETSPNQVEISVENASGKHKWLFEREKDGLVLKNQR